METRRKKEKLWNDNIPEQLHARRYTRSPQYTIFFHPDYTVGPGIAPSHAFRLVGYTTGGELHPALKILIQFTTVYYQRVPVSMPLSGPSSVASRDTGSVSPESRTLCSDEGPSCLCSCSKNSCAALEKI